MTTLLLFSSNIRALYEQDILNLTAVPNGTRYRFRYLEKYVDPAVRGEWGPGLSGQPALVLYSLQQLKQYHDAVFFPIRTAEVMHAYVEAGVYVVEFLVGHSASLREPATSEAGDYAARVAEFRTHLLDVNAGVPYRYSASVLTGTVVGPDSPVEVAHDRTSDLELFERNTRYLGGVVSLADVRFVRVGGLFRREAWAKGSPMECERDAETTEYKLIDGKSYVLELVLYQSTESNLSGGFTLAVDKDVVESRGPAVIAVNSRYDVVPLELHAPVLGDRAERTGTITLSPLDGTHGATVSIPIRVRRAPGATAAALAVSVAGMSFIGAPSILKEFSVPAMILIVGGAMIATAASFTLRKSVRWPF